MSTCWIRLIAAVGGAALLLSAGCGKPSGEAGPEGDATASATSEATPEGDAAGLPRAGRKPTIGYEHLFQLGTGILSQKAYLFKLAVWPTTDRPLSGVLQVRAYGDVSGVSGRGNNADILPLDGVVAKRSNASIFYYFLNSPAIRGEDIAIEEVGQKVNLALVIEYSPPSTKTRWEPTKWVLTVRDGQVKEVDLAATPADVQQWLNDRGIPATALQVAQE